MEFLNDDISQISTTYFNKGDEIEVRINVWFKSGGHFSYHEYIPRCSPEINDLNLIGVLQRAKIAIHVYLNNLYFPFVEGTIVGVRYHCPTLRECWGVITADLGDGIYQVYFKDVGVIDIGYHYLIAFDILSEYEKLAYTWEAKNRYSESDARLLHGLQRKQ
jgi:hypothetical protein